WNRTHAVGAVSIEGRMRAASTSERGPLEYEQPTDRASAAAQSNRGRRIGRPALIVLCRLCESRSLPGNLRLQEISAGSCMRFTQTVLVGPILLPARLPRLAGLIIRVHGVEALVGQGECGREVHLACDHLDVARRFARGGPGQRGVELTKRGHFRREPAPAAQGGGQGVIVPGGE